VREVPSTGVVAVEHETERLLHVRAGDEGQGVVQRVTEPDVDVPDAPRVVVGREIRDREDEVVAGRRVDRSVGPCTAPTWARTAYRSARNSRPNAPLR
jgi:hypothetical protein